MATSQNLADVQTKTTPRWLFAAKVLIAALLLSALGLVAARSVLPALAWWQVLLAVAGLAVAIVLLIVVFALVTGRMHQFTLNHGGTDAQWMWWGSEPPGLQKARRDNASRAQRGDRTPPPPA